jgi:hypothetical protein
MKYAILMLAGVFAMAVTGELCAQPGENGDAEELEMLKRAWEQDREERHEENPLGRNSESRNSLEDLLGLMKAVERRLAKEDSGAKTQELQEEILEILKKWIEDNQPKEPGESPSDSPEGGSGKKEPGSEHKESREKPGLVDPSRSSEPAQPGSERKRELLRKADSGAKTPAYGPTGRKSGDWNPRLPGSSSQKELQEGATEERPPQKAELIDRYFKELLKERPGK